MTMCKGDDIMPYIPETQREPLEYSILHLVAVLNKYPDDNRGRLNYIISRLMEGIISDEEISYNEINDLIGVLECAKLELYRRLAAPYEDKKIVSNSDVYK